MRKLVYVCTKGNSTVRTISFAQAEDLRMGGWNVTEILEDVPNPANIAPKQFSLFRVKI